MAAKFELGSIVDIVNNPNKNKKSPKKKRNQTPQDESATEVKPEPKLEEKKKSPEKASGKKRKAEKIEEDTVTEKTNNNKPMKKKKQKKELKLKSENEEIAEVKGGSEESDEKQTKNDDDNTVQRLEKLSRTVFVGNLPASFAMKNLKKTFSQFGSVASIRVRGVAPAKQTLSKKAAYLSKQINPNKKTVNAYLVFHKVDSVPKALALNGTTFEDSIIRVDKVEENANYQNILSVFLGNLSFKTTEDEIREFFKDCGEIINIRLIRDSTTGIGKGFGYVTFSSKDGVVLALEKSGQPFNGREIRVKTYQYNQQDAKKTMKGKKKNMQNKNAFQKKTVSPIKNKKGKFETPEKPKPKGGNLNSKIDFKGELTSKKKLSKKASKSQQTSRQANKQKKKIAEILSK